MFNGTVNSERSKEKKTGVHLEGVGMEEHIQASGGASGHSQGQVVADNTPLVRPRPMRWNRSVYCRLASLCLQGNKGVEENNVRNQYSIPGILHFIQHEWAR